jgi:hypothetical protein
MKIQPNGTRKLLPTLFALLVSSASIQAGDPLVIQQSIAPTELGKAPVELTIHLYENQNAVVPVASQTFEQNHWTFKPDSSAQENLRIRANFTHTDDLDMSRTLWFDAEVDGRRVGSRQALGAEAPLARDISVETYIESRSGGFIFPDASVQNTAGITTETDPNLAAHAANASAHHIPYTDAGAVAAIKAADGSGSGLDADLLDGQHGSAFAAAAHSHGADYVNVTGDTMTGKLTINSSEAADLHGDLALFETDGTKTVDIDADFGKIELYNDTGVLQLQTAGDNGTGGFMHFYNEAGIQTVRIDGDANDGAGYIQVENSAGLATIRMDAQEVAGDGAEITMYNTIGTRTLQIDSDSGTQGGYIRLYDATGNPTITLDGQVGGDGRITTQELAITGGSDLSEQFDINAPKTPVEAGMLVSIDPQNPGKLILSHEAYDHKVAGIISGAGGVKPGMMMGQQDTIANGEYPVALTGRVYALVDTSESGQIKPGDLLTTSSIPGYAMKATDAEKRSGSVIGKAMTSLKAGKGLVLVLVSLQ